MPATEQERIFDLATERSVRRGRIIFQRGDTDSSLMAVLGGSVRISTGTAGGKELTLNTIGKGEVLGEIALLDGSPRHAKASQATAGVA